MFPRALLVILLFGSVWITACDDRETKQAQRDAKREQIEKLVAERRSVAVTHYNYEALPKLTIVDSSNAIQKTSYRAVTFEEFSKIKASSPLETISLEKVKAFSLFGEMVRIEVLISAHEHGLIDRLPKMGEEVEVENWIIIFEALDPESRYTNAWGFARTMLLNLGNLPAEQRGFIAKNCRSLPCPATLWGKIDAFEVIGIFDVSWSIGLLAHAAQFHPHRVDIEDDASQHRSEQ